MKEKRRERTGRMGDEGEEREKGRKGEMGKKEKGRELEEERDQEVKKDVTGWTVVTTARNREREQFRSSSKRTGPKWPRWR